VLLTMMNTDVVRAFSKKLVLPLLASEAVITGAVAIMYLTAAQTSLDQEGRRYLTLAWVLGGAIVLFCWPICTRLNRLKGALAGIVLGLAVPILGGWIWGRLADQFMSTWGHYWTPLDAWTEGLVLSVPGALAGALVGFLQAKKASRLLR
jgi:putative effector of murein hydrolase